MKVWLGFVAEEILFGAEAGSPKSHDVPVIVDGGATVEVLLKFTRLVPQSCSAVNEGVGCAATVTGITMVEEHPELEVAMSVTLNVPGPVKMCVGFCSVDVLFPAEAGSPKFHDQPVIVPVPVVELSVNCVEEPKHTVVFVNAGVTCGDVLTGIAATEQPVEVVTITV